MEEYLRHAAGLDVLDFRGIMDLHGQEVWNYIYFLTGKADAADDLSQETFIRAYRYISTFRGESSLRTWLLKIARNLVYDYRKKSWFRRVLLMERVLGDRKGRSAEEEYFSLQLTDEIWTVVAGLPLKMREVLLLDAVHELSQKEIAEMLNISVGTVKSRIHRARAKLSEQLQKEGIPYE
ncbi:RNA polymerase sigma factor [Paenibacillus mucilaginosus]|uniref:ECF subfamily RNA polymerase sigma-24 subunit n=3 Tax=Paenibacillus mucilaginosus TaxID=61624 RepID=H6NQR3_9BACL|nr:RNA polymerase sigma factor [Paenibacillus mucilaginosus]AEI45884.1 RNA polymerase, sigma-24 subunit, ECF subfamily [Paenibacillus mucilaginosus KNP414]AFC33531.1 ECF subfamily RNA polymerase sigma-24 subunit [Paenibacillus mucilaginosus 3016]AFH65853.1 RNA polymerase subunit sigma-24 [Paenibacillus mucilaginosus K02]MCG7217779.1 RNA polymerase sigma factor [Paenibacillus mucilaginosus]WDM27248.1 RNA polymerase sigma factor [Paenibacillus mucilaginosus]